MKGTVRALGQRHWGWLAATGMYLSAVILVANLAFGENTFYSGAGTPARTGSYDATHLPRVAAANPDTIGKAVMEATGGPPTVSSQPPPTIAYRPVATITSVATARSISNATTPNYTAAVKITTATTPNWLKLLLSFPLNLTFPTTAKPKRG